mmetsp:Transcript_131091/g.245345  ORF Transcript_131091/g.245345 Transcript_131091/m.245345 type:complete len:214 (+) Transcript_131091:2-643(+)
MEDLTLKTQTLHATEMRAWVAEQRCLELQMQVLQSSMNAKEAECNQQLQGWVVPPGMGYPLGAQEPCLARPLNEAVTLPVGIVMPPPTAEVSMPVRSKKKNRIPQTQASLPRQGLGLLSRGSKNHALSRCRPCQFYFTTQGCADGALCNFCHYPHSQAKMLEAAMYSAKAAEKRAGKKKSPKALQMAPAVVPPPADTLPLSFLGMALGDVESC